MRPKGMRRFGFAGPNKISRPVGKEVIAMAEMKTVYPKRIDSLLTNPGIGFIAAPGLMGDQETICDSRGNPVEKYKFTPQSKTWNHPDSKIFYCGARWQELEPQKGVYCWEPLERRLQKAKELGCTAVVRCKPYALEDEDIPGWFREECPEEPEFPFWRADPNASPYADYWSDFIRAFAMRFDGHPLISSVDMALVGAWGEGGGTELVKPEKLRQMIDAYIDNFKITPLQALLHDPKSLEIIRGRREKIGFRVDCLGDMGGFHGERWSHMLDFYPENIVNFQMSEAWKKAPVVFEACWHMNDWYLQGWDIDYIIDESLKWHISSYNGKGTPVPLEWKPSVERWLKKMGYRFELRKLSWQETAEAGKPFFVCGLWANTGVAPIYRKYPLTLRLVKGETVFSLQSREDIRGWLPDRDIWWEESVLLPPGIPEGDYELQLGIETGVKEIGNIRLGIAGEKDGFYPMGCLSVKGEKR